MNRVSVILQPSHREPYRRPSCAVAEHKLQAAVPPMQIAHCALRIDDILHQPQKDTRLCMRLQDVVQSDVTR